MRLGLRWGGAAAAVFTLATVAVAQIESRCLPPNRPKDLFPQWVTVVSYACQEMTPPPDPGPGSAPQDRARTVRNLGEMPEAPREAIRLAMAGKYREAVAAAVPILKLESTRHDDYTWDYLANAAAWAYIQLGDLKAASGAHSAAAVRIIDIDVAEAHRAMATMLDKTTRPAAELKDYAVFKEEMRKILADRIKQFTVSVELAQKAGSGAARERYLERAWTDLRVLLAAEPETGRQLTDTAFRRATDGIATEVIPGLLAYVRAAQRDLDLIFRNILKERDFPVWNQALETLWGRVRDVKSFCRMYEHLAQLGLATPGRVSGHFEKAHQALFAEGNQLVWQEIGKRTLLNDISHYDLRRRVPWQETAIAPLGVVPGSEAPPPAGYRKMEDTIDGKMRPMDGEMKPMKKTGRRLLRRR
jgi:hypothetical protein